MHAKSNLICPFISSNNQQPAINTTARVVDHIYNNIVMVPDVCLGCAAIRYGRLSIPG